MVRNSTYAKIGKGISVNAPERVENIKKVIFLYQNRMVGKKVCQQFASRVAK